MTAGQDGMPPIPAGSRYVAMGSSFAAGPGISPRAAASPRRAGRSSGNYAHLVARPLGLDLHDVTYSGATTGDILRPSAAGQPAQLDAVTPDTRLVTITAGGNDVGFLPRLTLASLPWPLRALPRVRARVAGRGGFICRCAAGRRTTPTRPGWRPSPNSCSRPSPRRLAEPPADSAFPAGARQSSPGYLGGRPRAGRMGAIDATAGRRGPDHRAGTA